MLCFHKILGAQIQKGNMDIIRLKEPRELDAYQASEISIQNDSNDAKHDTAKHPSQTSTFSPTHDDTLPTMVNVYKVISKSNTTLESQ